ncbi:MAG: ZIP family metal transporter [Leptospirales bacterium]
MIWESQLLNTIFYSAVAAFSTLAGVALMLFNKKWTARNSIHFVSFSAGVVLTIAFLHLIPEALEHSPVSLTAVLFTLLGFYSLEHVLVIHHCKEEDCEVHTMGSVAFTGMAFHSLLDGFIIGVGFEASAPIGFAAAFGVLLHKFPVGVSITAMLMHDHYPKRKTILLGSLIALATPAGAILAFSVFLKTSPELLGVFLAISAGSFIYIGASDLLPETHKNHRKSNIPMVFLGVGLMYVVSLLFSH